MKTFVAMKNLTHAVCYGMFVTCRAPLSHAQDIAADIHCAARSANEVGLRSVLTFAAVTTKKNFQRAHCLYQGQRPLHIVSGAICTRLLLQSGADPKEQNEKGITPLVQQVTDLIVLYDSEQKANKEKLLELRAHKKAAIELLAKKYNSTEREQALRRWKRMLEHYKHNNRLSQEPPEGYVSMVQTLLCIPHNQR